MNDPNMMGNQGAMGMGNQDPAVIELQLIEQEMGQASIEQQVQILGRTLSANAIKLAKDNAKNLPSSQLDGERKKMKEVCEKFMSSSNSGNTNTAGYVSCCDVLDLCGSGMTTWIIVIIIIVILGCIAAGGAAFFFFYWNRKMGGRDEEAVEDKEIESEECTSKSEHEISVDTY
ncbi:unnamed protein product [Caenorhabditis nigoni]